MPAATAEPNAASRRRRRAIDRPRPATRGGPLLLSIAVHLLLGTLLLVAVVQPPTRRAAAARPRTIELSYVVPAPVAPKLVLPPTLDAIPTPRTAPLARLAPLPRPAPRRPPEPARTLPKTAPGAAERPTPRPDAPPDANALETVLGDIRDNWLEPPGVPASLRCRVQIEHAAGGAVRAVRLSSGCGSPELVDSIRRAVWKTTPLPLPPNRRGAGTLEIEFTP